MKTKIFGIALAAIIAAGMLVGCSESVSDDKGANTGANDPAQTSNEVVTDPTDSPEPEQESTPAEEIDYSGIANELFGALDQIDRLGGTAVPYDETVTYTEGDTVFYLLPKMPYTSVADLKEYMESHLTENMIASRYSDIIGTDNPIYIDHDGALYVRSMARGCGFAFYQEDNAPKISDESENGFTARMDFDNYGGKSTLAITVVKDGDFWKIDSMNVEESE